MSATLKHTRITMGLSLAKLAELSGIGRSTLGNYETGVTRMSDEKIALLAGCLKTTPDNILPLNADTLQVGEAQLRESPSKYQTKSDHRHVEIEELNKQLKEMREELGDIRKLLVSLLAEERARGTEPIAKKKDELAG